jgi:hypothetical protein
VLVEALGILGYGIGQGVDPALQLLPEGNSDAQMERVRNHHNQWVTKLSDLTEGTFREADKSNFLRACLVAGALGMFSHSGKAGEESTPLDLALRQLPAELRLEEKVPETIRSRG